MGTASTMACIAEALGLILPGTAAIPAVHADRLRAAEATGVAAVNLIGSQVTPDRIVNEKSVENALRVLLALGGSTNAIIHLTAIAGRAGVKVTLDQLNQLSDTTPVLVNLKPVGNGYMEDFFAAGGMGALLRELKPLLHLDCLTVTGDTLGERLAADDGRLCRPHHHRGARQAVRAAGRAGRAVRQSRAQGRDPQALGGRRKAVRARGRAVVFSSLADLAARIDDPALDVRAEDILVLQNAGPHAPEAMPEAGYLPIPKKLAQKRRQGHGPHLRRAHERHRLRHHRAARDAGRRVRRPARAGAQRRPHPAVGEGPAHRTAGRRRRAEEARRAGASRRRRSRRAAMPSSMREQILGADEGCDFAFLRPQ